MLICTPSLFKFFSGDEKLLSRNAIAELEAMEDAGLVKEVHLLDARRSVLLKDLRKVLEHLCFIGFTQKVQ